ncbi:conserved hypothetical protein [Thermobaculum terrenum ATCC BAA-798]|uniref:DUF1772 domain-containing protein n=1 Tax=Thermobaculum terrenum (strain ATCC BAA-798 / CCMEE 7001 / YNP1) TaxID=525904 RepID=D1CJ33_THET1|nr:DUF1772 domain-containing protein [Thermobaculum terrenum]ACZ43753.1 conserved hypothetical protein [Thermobaculum terrenum ATCC BAA-798]
MRENLLRFVNWIRFINLLSAAIAFGLALAHTLEIPGKRGLDSTQWLAVQQSFYGGFALVGVTAELLGLITCLLLLLPLRKRPRALVQTVIGALCFLGMLLIYFFVNRPINSRIASWTPTTIPDDWTFYRNLWDYSRLGAALLATVAIVLLLLAALMPDAPREATQPAAQTKSANQ